MNPRIKLEELQMNAVQSAEACMPKAHQAAMAIGSGEVNRLHVAASMDIDETAESLKHILAYKQEASRQMLRSSDEGSMKAIAEIIVHADNVIKQVLGM